MTGELLLITGPPAVGKMTVRRAVAARSDFRLFHNHHTIEPLMEVFGHGTRAFSVLDDEFRLRVVQEAAAEGPSLVFTFAWWVDDPGDVEVVAALLAPYADAGLVVRFVELYADLPTRLVRNTGADLDLPSPADDLLARFPHLRLRTQDRTAEDVATEVLDWVGA